MPEALAGRVCQIVSSVLGVPLERIDDETSPDTITSWDSMQHLQLVLALEQEFGVEFTVEEIEAMQRVGVITSLVDARLSSR